MFTSEDCPNEGLIEEPLCFHCAKVLNCDPKERKEDLMKIIYACKNECCKTTRMRSLLSD